MIQKINSNNMTFSAYSEEQLVTLVKHGNALAENELIVFARVFCK